MKHRYLKLIMQEDIIFNEKILEKITFGKSKENKNKMQ